MLRSEVIQAALNLFTDSRYLEIGVDQGITFHQVKASYKVAVDPRFCFDTEQARLERPDCRYYEITSDQFFQNHATQHPAFDVIFLDGLHTFEQTLRDLFNAIAYLRSDGIVIIDDIRPVSYSSSLRDEAAALVVKRHLPQESDGAWMGDVYRLLFSSNRFCRRSATPPFRRIEAINCYYGNNNVKTLGVPIARLNRSRVLSYVIFSRFKNATRSNPSPR